MKKDGTLIHVKFTQPLVGDITGNEPYFKVSFKERLHSRGPLIDSERTINRIREFNTVDEIQVDLQNGTYEKTYYTEKGLKLAIINKENT